MFSRLIAKIMNGEIEGTPGRRSTAAKGKPASKASAVDNLVDATGGTKADSDTSPPEKATKKRKALAKTEDDTPTKRVRKTKNMVALKAEDEDDKIGESRIPSSIKRSANRDYRP